MEQIDSYLQLHLWPQNLEAHQSIMKSHVSEGPYVNLRASQYNIEVNIEFGILFKLQLVFSLIHTVNKSKLLDEN